MNTDDYIELGVDPKNRALPQLAKLRSYHVGNQKMSSLFPALQLQVGKEYPPEKQKIVTNRSLVPKQDLVSGATARVAEKLKGPWMYQSPPLPNYERNMDIWWGWRPDRDEIPSSDLPIEMPIRQTSYKFETLVPSELDIQSSVEESATQPFPTVPARDLATPIFEDIGMGNLGDAASDLIKEAELKERDAKMVEATNPNVAATYRLEAEKLRQQAAQLTTSGSGILGTVSSLASSIANTLTAKYTSEAAKYAAKTPTLTVGTNYAGTLPLTPSSGNGIPWGTIAMVGAVGLGAIFVLPMLLGKRK